MNEGNEAEQHDRSDWQVTLDAEPKETLSGKIHLKDLGLPW